MAIKKKEIQEAQMKQPEAPIGFEAMGEELKSESTLKKKWNPEKEERLTITLTASKRSKLYRIKAREGWTFKAIVEEALKQFIDNYESENGKLRD